MSAKQPERRWTLDECEAAYDQASDTACLDQEISWRLIAEMLNALPESLPPETGKRDLPLERGKGEFDEATARASDAGMYVNDLNDFVSGARWQFERMKK